MFQKFLAHASAVLLLAGAAHAELSPSSQVVIINQLGTAYPNSHRGGFIFATANMPAGIVHFIVEPTDVGLKQFLSQVELSLINGRSVQVEFNRVGAEGAVVTLILQ